MAEDLESTVAEFISRADGVYAEYDQGYRDADATLRELRAHLDELRTALTEREDTPESDGPP